MYSEAEDVELHRRTFHGILGTLENEGLQTSGFEFGLDLGGGFGTSAPFMLSVCKRTIISDIIRYNAYENGRFLSLFAEKMSRNGLDLDLDRVEFQFVDAQDLIYKNELFDFIYSVNAFEHIPDPRKAWNEIMRVTTPGAIVAIQFDPIWTSAYGHHLFDLPIDPWDHLILPESDFEDKVRYLGGSEDHIHIYRTAMNRLPFQEHRDILRSIGESFFEKYQINYWDKDPSSQEIYQHRNFGHAISSGYEADHLRVRGFSFVGKRKR